MSEMGLPRIERRVRAADRAVHLLAVAASDFGGRRLRTSWGRISGIPFGRIALVVRYVDGSQWTGSALEHRRSSREWLWGEARAHEAVLRRMAGTAFAPVAPLAVFADVDELEAYARERYRRWRRALTRVRDREEWVLHLVRGPHLAPEPEPYALRAGMRGAIDRGDRFGPEIAAHVAHVRDVVAPFVTNARRASPVLERGRVLDVTLLADIAHRAALRDAFARLAAAGRGLALATYVEGPLPPFTFG